MSFDPKDYPLIEPIWGKILEKLCPQCRTAVIWALGEGRKTDLCIRCNDWLASCLWSAKPKPLVSRPPHGYPDPWRWTAHGLVDVEDDPVIRPWEFGEVPKDSLVAELIRVAPLMEALLRDVDTWGKSLMSECRWCQAALCKEEEHKTDCVFATVLAGIDAARKART